MEIDWGSDGGSFITLMMQARNKIVATGESSGILECPKCKGRLHWTRAIAYNGHVHARCETEDCLAWME